MSVKPPASRYPGLETITDPALKRVLKQVFDMVGGLQVQAQQIGSVSQPLTTPLHAGSQQIKALADPSAPQDAVTLRYLQHYVESRVHTVTAAVVGVGGVGGPPPPPPPPTGVPGLYMVSSKISPPGAAPPPAAGEWPQDPVIYPDAIGLQYTAWIVLQVAGVWYTSGFIQMWVGRPDTGSAPIGAEFAKNWAYDTRWGPMNGQTPPPGTVIGVFASAGNARGFTGVSTVRERTEVVQLALPDANASPPGTSQPLTHGFDLATASVYNSPPDIATWPVTGAISKVTMAGTTFQ